MTIKLSLKEALLGFRKEYTHLNGKPLIIESSEVIQPKSVKTMPGYGMKRSEAVGYGNLYVAFEIEFPTNMNPEMAKEISEVL